MAKSSRASSRKANNQRLAAKVFGPVEDARVERLSARLLEAARQPKPETSDVKMDAESTDQTSFQIDYAFSSMDHGIFLLILVL